MIKKLIMLFCLATGLALAQNAWEKIGNMPRPIYGGRAVVVDTTIFIIGGFDQQLPNSSSSKYSDSIRVYYPESGTWGKSVKMVEARYGLIAVNYNDSLLYFGGVKNNIQNSNSVEIWNGSSTPYVFKLNPDFDRHYGTGVMLANSLYLFGGGTSFINFNYFARIEAATGITLSTDNFNLSSIITNQVAATDGNDIYLFGGIQSGLLINKIIKYDTTLKSLSVLTKKLNSPLVYCNVIYTGNNNFYIIGGIDENTVLNNVEIFNSALNNISSGPPLNIARQEMMSVKYKNSIYVFGGLDVNKQAIKEIEKLDVITQIDDNKYTIPGSFKLFNNFPNPFNPSTVIKYSVQKSGFVTIKVYNVLGMEVATLVNEQKAPGTYEVIFNSLKSGLKLESGVYFYRMQIGNFTKTKKMILIK